MTSRLAVVFAAMSVGVASVGFASAQPLGPDEHARRLAAAHEARKAAQAANTREAFAACGQAYLAAYNADPLWTHGDELLWTAGWCFEDAQSLGVAIALFERVITTYPRSMFARRALGQVGWAYADLAMYARAADRLEEYAKRYPSDPAAHLHLIDAIRYRAGLGDRDKWIELTSYYVGTFGAQKPHLAAELSYALTDAYAGEVELQVAHLKAHLQRSQLGTADRIIALTRLGELLWTRACPVPTTDGLCVAERRPRAAGQCGSATPPVEYAIVTRGDRDRQQALAHFNAAIALQQQEHEMYFEARHAAARAQLALADDALEHALAVPVPKGADLARHDLGTRTRNRRVVDRWLAERQRAVDQALAASRAAAVVADAAAGPTGGATNAALYRTARARELLWHAVMTVRLPADAELACPIMRDLARPLREQTLEAYGACAAKATVFGGQAPEVLMCLRARETWGVLDYPPQRELVAEPMLGSGVLAVEPPLASTPW